MEYNHHAITRSLYIHWPFCPYKCHFCPFVAIASQDQFMGRYHKALCSEIEQFGILLEQKSVIDTIFMGGGTPSTYPDDMLLDMFSILKRNFDISQVQEVTIEVNPGTVRKEQLAIWKRAGINRLSIGVQSLNDSVLKKLNRHQSARDVYEVIEYARTEFDNISVDLILGLPDVSIDEWKELLKVMVAMPLKHLSIYFLTIHEDTPLYFKVQKNTVELPCDDALVDLYYWSIDFLAAHGFVQYEISNFAREGYASLHNRAYWERNSYKGFGLGACSFDGSVRLQNEKSLMKYIEGVESKGSVTTMHEVLTRKQRYIERVMLGIRQMRGACLSDLLADLSSDEQSQLHEQLVWLKNNNFIYEKNGQLILTPTGLSVENTVAIRLSL